VQARDEAQDRGGVVEAVIDLTFFSVRRNHDRRDARTGTPAIAGRWRDVIPPAAVFIKGDHDDHIFPLRRLLQVLDHVGDVGIARLDVRVTGVQVEITLRLVESYRRQFADDGIGEEFVGDRAIAHPAIAQMFGAVLPGANCLK